MDRSWPWRIWESGGKFEIVKGWESTWRYIMWCSVHMAKCGWQVQKEVECYSYGTCQWLSWKRMRQLRIWLRVTQGDGEIPSSFRQVVKKERWRWVQVTLICGVQYVSYSFSRRSVIDVWWRWTYTPEVGSTTTVMKNLILLECWLWRRREGTTIAGGVTWSLGVIALLVV